MTQYNYIEKVKNNILGGIILQSITTG